MICPSFIEVFKGLWLEHSIHCSFWCFHVDFFLTLGLVKRLVCVYCFSCKNIDKGKDYLDLVSNLHKTRPLNMCDELSFGCCPHIDQSLGVWSYTPKTFHLFVVVSIMWGFSPFNLTLCFKKIYFKITLIALDPS